MRDTSIKSPKLRGASSVGRSHWYPYYAGYSPDFVIDALKHLGISSGTGKLVVDPWNGAGTTTTICSMQNVVSTGFDINPAMVVVAKARLLDTNTAASLPPILSAILERSRADSYRGSTTEPLGAWFTKGTAARIRSIERAVQRLLVAYEIGDPSDAVNRMSTLAAFFYVLLFRLVRRSAREQAVSNPTWTKRIVADEDLISLSQKEIADQLESDLKDIQLRDSTLFHQRTARSDILKADSRNLPLGDGVAQAVISSPPYCTRIDYAVATRMELAVLGAGSNEAVGKLRREMLGTTLSPINKDASKVIFPRYISSLLQRIGEHKSKASKSYYQSTYRDYFEKLKGSLDEVGRIVKSDGKVMLVVQDSAYKDVHVDLARATADIMSELGFGQARRWDFECERSMRDLGSIRRRVAKPVESVLLFSR